jgi:hypothetical protein
VYVAQPVSHLPNQNFGGITDMCSITSLSVISVPLYH